jgi:hypothetical protein
MKRLMIVLFGLMLLGAFLPVMGQTDSLITLNDLTPAINVNVTLPPDATGVVSLNLSMAAVTVTDAQGNTVFQEADARVHAVELSLAPNSGSHVIRVERLPGVTEANVMIQSLADLTDTGKAEFVQFENVSFNQERALPLGPASPGHTLALNLPMDMPGIVTTTFRGGNVTSQFVDSNGAVVATSSGGGIDGLNMILAGGAYTLTLMGNGLSQDITAGVRLMSADTLGVNLLPIPANNLPVADTSTTVATTSGEACAAVINSSSVNLRSGPGTAYSVLEYGYFNQTLAVGGTNQEQNWLVVGGQSGSAWIARELVQLNGACDALTVFNIPLRNAQPATLIVQAAPSQIIPPASSSGGSQSQSESGGMGGDNESGGMGGD